LPATAMGQFSDLPELRERWLGIRHLIHALSSS
jgi:hypothetical protein